MKKTISILIISLALALNLKAQQMALDTLVDVRFDAVPLKEALLEISQKYGLRFSYSDSKLPMDKLISCDYKLYTLRNFLNDFFHKNEINFNIIDNQIVLYPFNTNRNIIVKGSVIDDFENTPVPYANISIAGTNRGTSSNEDGKFEISLENLPAELLISHLSHEKKLVYVYDETQEMEIRIVPAQTILQGITVKAKGKKNANYNLVKKAYEKLGKSSSEMQYGKAFYRQKSKREDTFTEIFEIFYDVKYSTNGIEDWAVQEGRYAFQNEHEYDIFLYNKNFTLLSRMFPLRQPATESYIIPINPDVKKLFTLELQEVIKFDERQIAIISFTPNETVSAPAAQGELYIDIDTEEVLKMKGSITDSSLEIIGFNDPKSSWNNYELDFEISFLEDHATGKLLMDYVQIDHTFDYYFNKSSIGKINTSSILTFYEHYSPVKNKKLGGAIDYKKSDMSVIDGIGYNAAFWHQNPIVRRTPLEEKLIQDFERNEAFGVVFMNNEEEVVLLPDKKNSEKARKIIATYESNIPNTAHQLLYLRTDKDSYQAGEKLNFTAYFLDKLTLKASTLGSVLTIELYNNKNNLISTKKYDIDQGHAYGDLALSEAQIPGTYHIRAYTNIDKEQTFEKNIGIGYQLPEATQESVDLSELETQDIKVDFYPEGGTLLVGVETEIAFQASTKNDIPVSGQWHWRLRDDTAYDLSIVQNNRLGLGVFQFIPQNERRYSLLAQLDDHEMSWPLPTAKNEGFAMKVDDNIERSLRVNLHQKPALPRDFYLLSIAGGKVFSFYEKRINGASVTIDLPTQHLPGGVNTLIAMDAKGNVLAQRSFFIQPSRLNIQLESASFKSKRSKRLELKFRINDENGNPIKAHLNALFSQEKSSDFQQNSINQYIYFHGSPISDITIFNLENDSIRALIDMQLLASTGNTGQDLKHGEREEMVVKVHENSIDDLGIAEVSVSGNFAANSGTKTNTFAEQRNIDYSENTSYWIPKLDIHEAGFATIEYKIENKNKLIYVNIQGLSENGLVGDRDFTIDPKDVEDRKK